MSDIHPLRAAHEFYSTPPEAKRALLSVESFDGLVWEPACGHGAIAKVLIAARIPVVSTDLIHRGWGTGGIDFLAETTARGRHVITNPPFGRGLADRFIRHALTLTRPAGGKVAMLLDLASLAHPVRTTLFTANPPAAIYALDELVCLPNGQRNAAISATMRFCWVVWHPDHSGRPTFWWLSPYRFRRPGDPA